ncbi:MAG: DUF3795 domain-containing protein [Kiritimatiellaeota bacterium]|nr:DUF3795 domain-containing protein [Kiritimatiellota bacterium]
MRKQNGTSRREFVACCVCAGCAGLAGAADEAPKKTLTPLGGGAAATGAKTYDFAFCGIYCSACKLRLKGGDDGRKCVGCTSPKMESQCAVFKCAKERKITACGLCADFEKCEKLKRYHSEGDHLYRKAARKNCERIKKDGGTDKLAAEQKTRWTCKACKKTYFWAEGTDTCPWCKKPVEPLTEKDLEA